MKIIFGLGNPGENYTFSRHNFGWQALDFFYQEVQNGAIPGVKISRNWQEKPKFRAKIAELSLEIPGAPREKILLVKPLTFYNLAGESARAILDFYKISTDVFLLIHDEIDLAIGQIRTRKKGRDAGNNGVKNLISHLGENFARLRIGSGKSREKSDIDGNSRPISIDSRDYVLATPNAREREILAQIWPKTAEIICDFARGKFAETSYKL